MPLRSSLAVVAASVIAVAACGLILPTESGEEAVFSGEIVALNLQGGALTGRPNVHVRPESDECGIAFVVGEDTRVLVRRSHGAVSEGTFDDLAVGRSVRVRYPGLVLLSCPGQSGATEIVIFE